MNDPAQWRNLWKPDSFNRRLIPLGHAPETGFAAKRLQQRIPLPASGD